MTPQEYQNYVRRKQKKSPLGKDMALAFLIGGLICAAGQGILNGWLAAGLRGEDAAAATSISLVFLSALLTALRAPLWLHGLLVDGTAWVAKQLELSAAAGEAPAQVAKTLVETARARALRTGRPDDITAAVLRLENGG